MLIVTKRIIKTRIIVIAIISIIVIIQDWTVIRSDISLVLGVVKLRPKWVY